MKPRLLLVDDEQPIRHSLGEILRLEGYEVVTAESGEAAIEHLKDQTFDLVLLDLKMPGLSGLDVMHFINNVAPDTKVILLTAHGSLESAIEALRQGAHDYILKPASSHTILHSLEQALSKRAELQHRRLLVEQLETSIQRLRDAEKMETKPSFDQQTAILGDDVVLDIPRREIWRGNRKISLTPAEGRLMKILLENRGRVLSHRELVFLVQGYETTEKEAPAVLRPLISRLRRKLSVFEGGDNWIVNVRGTGYLFEYPEKV
jgi:DNA-binding response OmpR family regulator